MCAVGLHVAFEAHVVDGSAEWDTMAWEPMAETRIVWGSPIVHDVAYVSQKAETAHRTIPKIMPEP